MSELKQLKSEVIIAPRVHAYILCWNEELILPYTLEHYSQFCEKIYILDNMSDDSSSEIANKYCSVEVKKWDSGGEIRDDLYAKLKSSVYKNSRGMADWVIVCDADEFLVGSNELSSLKSLNITLPKVTGFQMTSRFFPKFSQSNRYLTKIVRTGFRDEAFDKQIIFDPTLDLSFKLGAHNFTVENGPIKQAHSNLKLLHFKYLGLRYLSEKNARSANRLSKFNKQLNLGTHYHTNVEDTLTNLRSCLRVSRSMGA